MSIRSCLTVRRFGFLGICGEDLLEFKKEGLFSLVHLLIEFCPWGYLIGLFNQKESFV